MWSVTLETMGSEATMRTSDFFLICLVSKTDTAEYHLHNNDKRLLKNRRSVSCYDFHLLVAPISLLPHTQVQKMFDVIYSTGTLGLDQCSKEQSQ